MATQTYQNGVTLTDAAEFNRFDTAAYCVLGTVAGTNTITAVGPANYSYSAALPPVWFIPAATNTGATTINITPSGGVAGGAKNIFFNGAACKGGELKAGVPAVIVYDGTQYNAITPGLLVQRLTTSSGSVDSSTTTIPVDDSIPQNTEGKEWSALNTTITPKSTTNKLLIELTVACVSTTASNEDTAFALFQDSTANALNAVVHRSSTANSGSTLTLRHIMDAGTTSATTFKVRYGPTGGTTSTVNGVNTNRVFGGVAISSLTVTEYTQ